MYFFVGGPASGKSAVIEDRYRDCGALVDSDVISPMLPHTLDGTMAWQTSKRIATWMMEELLKARVPVVLAATGARYEDCARWFEIAKAQGYRRVLVHVVCPREEAWARNTRRNRQLNRAIFDECWNACEANIPRLYLSADELQVIWNG